MRKPCPGRIADFLEYRLERNPRMMGVMFRLEGLPARPRRSRLEQLAQPIALAVSEDG